MKKEQKFDDRLVFKMRSTAKTTMRKDAVVLVTDNFHFFFLNVEMEIEIKSPSFTFDITREKVDSEKKAQKDVVDLLEYWRE